MSLRNEQTNEERFPSRTASNSLRNSTSQIRQSQQIANTLHSTTGTDILRSIVPNNVIKRATPVLFSTNRGLHLRIAKVPDLFNTLGSNRLAVSTSAYDIHFCDLERWNTKANAVCLDDSFTNTQFAEFQQRTPREQGAGNFNCTFTRFNCR